MPGAVLFRCGPFTIYTYGVFVAAGVAAAWFLSGRRAAAFGLDADRARAAVLLFFLSGVAGGRLFYVLQHFPDYAGSIDRAFNVHEGGLVWYGGFFGALLAGAWMANRWGWPWRRVADFYAPVLTLAHAVGRIGCYFNGCCAGAFSIQLWESAYLFAAAAVLFAFGRLFGRRRDGDVFFLYLVLYGFGRFAFEFFRYGQTLHFFLTLPQWFSAASVLAGLSGFAVIRRKRSL